jgi:Fic family protein
VISDLLQHIDDLKAKIEALRPLDPLQERRIMQKFRLDWTYHSNAIEGNTLTYGETRAFLLYGLTAQGRPFRDYLDVRGHHAAIDSLQEIVRQQEPLNESVIRELHKMILVEPYDMPAQTKEGLPTKRHIVPGEYKKWPNHVKTSTGEMHYYAPPEATPAKMADLVAWYRQAIAQETLHPLILAATFHYQFVAIHPFDDGNGRMARLLLNLILLQAGFPPVVIRTDTKGNYLLALEKADADNDLEPFIMLIGESLQQSMELYLRGARGEDIEELADLDKKLALLEKKVAAYETQLEDQKNSLTAKKAWLLEHVIRPFFSQLLPQLAKFNRFFQESRCVSSAGGRDVQFSPEESEQLVAHVAEMMGKLSSLQVRYDWQKFSAGEPFDLGLILNIIGRDEDFVISYHFNSDHTVIFQGTYDQSFSKQEIDQQAIALANTVYEVIAKKVIV